MPQVYMQSDEGNRSANHVYTVSEAESRRLMNTVVKARVRKAMGLGHKAVEENVKLAIPATAEHRRHTKTPPEPPKLRAVKMLYDIPKHSAGKIYSYPENVAERLVNGRKSGGVRIRPVAVYVDTPEPLDRPFSPEPTVTAAIAKSLSAAGLGTAEAIAKASLQDLQKVKRVGLKSAEALKAAAQEYLR